MKLFVLSSVVCFLVALVPVQGFPARALLTQVGTDLGTAGDFAILSKAGVTNVFESDITGNIGASPITGAAIHLTCPEVSGRIYSVDAAGPFCKITDPTRLTTAISDMAAAYTNIAGLAPTETERKAGLIGGETFNAGVYSWSSSVSIPTDMTLTGTADDVFVFKIAIDLELASATRITLQGGAQANNVFWQVAGSVTLGSTSHFEGTVLSKTFISMVTGASVNGRLLAQTEVTLQKNTIVGVSAAGMMISQTAILGKYQGYPGSIKVIGSVKVEATNSELWMSGMIGGLTPSSQGGIHIHAGMTCADAGDHWYKTSAGVEKDGWKTLKYTSNADGFAKIDFHFMRDFLGFDNTMNLIESAGHTIVVHDSDSAGTRVACGLLGATRSVAMLDDYPEQDYVGVMGSILVEMTDEKLIMSGMLSGLPVNTTAGIHIHSGYSCAEDGLVGGHWYNTALLGNADPWNTTYTSDANGMATVYIEMNDTQLGYDHHEAPGHTVVVHNGSNKIACGLLGKSASAKMGPYPGTTETWGSQNDQPVMGSILVVATETELWMTGILEGLRPNKNSGIHIHSLTSCGLDADVGGHWYNSSATLEDVWIGIKYQSNANGVAKVDIRLTSAQLGYDPRDSLHKPVVVHDDSLRIACGKLGAESATAMMGSYPGQPASGVMGSILVEVTDEKLIMSGMLSGLPVSTTSGIHIHSGYSCAEDGLVGGHWYNMGVLGNADPWNTMYTSNADGLATVYIEMTDTQLAYDPRRALGHTVVVHDGANKIACGVLGGMMMPDMASTSTETPNTTTASASGASSVAPFSFLVLLVALACVRY